MGSGNNDARCFLRPKPKRPELSLVVGRCLGGFSKETWPVELPSEREDSDWRGTGSDKEEMPSAPSSWADSGSALGR